VEPLRADLAGQTCLVTGASAGIGLATARELARLGGRVVLAVRDPEKGERARRSIVDVTGREVELAVVDVASRESVRAFARELAARHPKLDVLVNNAGIWSERRTVGPDGVELV
jgi:NAD(P)-dependent dehydrogenase (short-subunit alcohol dehydrogenase family)